jgi:hypothetical protein
MMRALQNVEDWMMVTKTEKLPIPENHGVEQPPDTPDQAMLRDWRWAHAQLDSDAFASYSGQYVAVLDEAMVGNGLDPELLRQQVSRDHAVPENRVVVFHPDLNLMCD